MRDIKAVLFDNDGTLVDTWAIIWESFVYATREVLGRPCTYEELLATGAVPLDDQMLILANSDRETATTLSRVYRDYNHAIHDERIRAFDDVLEGIERLHDAGIAMGIVTSKKHALAWRGLSITGLAPYMGCCIAADDCDEHKPSAKPLLMAASELGVDPRVCAYVGDGPYDIRAAHAADMEAIGVLWGMFGAEILAPESPDIMCESFSELVDYLLGGA